MSDNFFLLKPDTLLHITYIGRHVTPERWNHFSRTVGEHIFTPYTKVRCLYARRGLITAWRKGICFSWKPVKAIPDIVPPPAAITMYIFLPFPS